MRLILIDNVSGYIFGDSADFASGRAMESASDAARLLDIAIHGASVRTYEERGPNHPVPANATAYHVYRADIGGSEATPVVWDGQDQETIDAVERECSKVAVVLCRDAADE